MTKLVGIDHSVDHLHHAVGHLKLEHGEHPPLGVVTDRARLAVDPGQPDGSAQGPARRKRPASSRATRSGPCSGALIACALPPPSAWNTTSGASMPSSASMSPPAAASKNLRASSSPSARRARCGAVSRPALRR